MGVYAVTAPTSPVGRVPWGLQGFAAALVAAGICAVGAFWDPAGSSTTDGWGDYWPALIFIGVVAWLAFGLAVRTANAMNASDRALGLTVLGGITLPAFWTGVSIVLVLAAGAALLRARRPLTVQDGISCFLAGTVMTIAVWLAFAG